MPFYIRKSVSVGPFRFNLSKSGIGVSAGVKGLRFGTGPRGHYVHAGRGGLYYRSTLSNKSDGGTNRPSVRSSNQPNTPVPPGKYYPEVNVDMIRVSSGDVTQMEDSRFSEVLDDLNLKQSSMSMVAMLGWTGAAISVVALLAMGAYGFIGGVFFTIAALLLGAWLDSFQRSSVLMYELEADAQSAYETMTAGFDAIMSCQGKWHIDAGGAVQDINAWKRNAGAAHLLDKRPTTLAYSLPRVVKSNITPPSIQSGKETLYFLPDFLLVVHDKKVGAVAYDALNIVWQDSNFIEDGTVPSDTTILYYNWKHPNKSGGPDRRFSDNYEIPVCLYESIYLTSNNGLNELLQVSRAGVTQPFAEAVKRSAQNNGSSEASINVPLLTE